MKDTYVLPKEMMARSLSHDEIVLNYEDVLTALDIFLEKGWAFLGWEGWGKYKDSSVGHCHYQGTVSINNTENKSWDEYAKDSYEFVKKTIIKDYKAWQGSDHAKEYELYFCITVTPKG